MLVCISVINNAEYCVSVEVMLRPSKGTTNVDYVSDNRPFRTSILFISIDIGQVNMY